MRNGESVAAFEKASYNREYREKNSDRIREVKRAYREANADTIRAKKAASYLANRDVERAKRKARRNPAAETARAGRWQRANVERKRAHNRAWQKRNSDKVLASRQRRLAVIAGAPGMGVTVRQWRQVQSESCGLCVYCNNRKPLTMDHIEPLSGGGAHDTENIAGACNECNASKGGKALIVWLARRAA